MPCALCSDITHFNELDRTKKLNDSPSENLVMFWGFILNTVNHHFNCHTLKHCPYTCEFYWCHQQFCIVSVHAACVKNFKFATSRNWNLEYENCFSHKSISHTPKGSNLKYDWNSHTWPLFQPQFNENSKEVQISINIHTRRTQIIWIGNGHPIFILNATPFQDFYTSTLIHDVMFPNKYWRIYI